MDLLQPVMGLCNKKRTLLDTIPFPFFSRPFPWVPALKQPHQYTGMKNYLIPLCLLLISFAKAQTLLRPENVFDGETLHPSWVVVTKDNKIHYVGPEKGVPSPKPQQEVQLPGATLMPGLIEGHSHLLLHPYNETSWNDQVLKESPVERAIRGSVHASRSLLAGITTMRDLGSEGAGYSDVYLKGTIEQGLVNGPRLLVAGPAIVATGAYGPKGFHDGVTVPLGAEEASGVDECIRTVRKQLGNGVDFIKIYADYRLQKGGEPHATFSVEEIASMVATAKSAGTYVVAHASTPEGMMRAIMGGVETIEHGDGGNGEVFALMQKRGVALCPTLAAGEAMEEYGGWKKNGGPEPDRITAKKKSFQLALEAGTQLVFGGDVGVFSHGDNFRELELMVEYGMSPLQVLTCATSKNADLFHLNDRGRLRTGLLADIIAVEGDPLQKIEKMREIVFVMKDGVIYKNTGDE
tara:strand:+ start:103072 stop:104463 length:1392 start_codon:yes stop_codon:yes gene_type:complete